VHYNVLRKHLCECGMQGGLVVRVYERETLVEGGYGRSRERVYWKSFMGAYMKGES
jgi:hypothetical protein